MRPTIVRPASIRSPRRRALAAALVTALFAAAPGAATADSHGGSRQLAFSVSGHASAAPDMAVIMVGVEAEAKSAAEAMAQQAERMTTVMETAAAAGVKAKDIQTTSISLSPVYVSKQSYDGPPQVSGYRASNMVEITLHTLDSVGPMLDRLVSAGADRIEGVRFELEDTSALETAARVAAVEAMKERRRFYAEDAGMPVGDLIALQEGGGGPILEKGPMMRLTQASTPVAPGDITATVVLNVVYRLRKAN